MYNCIINEMADVGVTERLDEPVQYGMDFATIYFYRTVRYGNSTVRSKKKELFPPQLWYSRHIVRKVSNE